MSGRLYRALSLMHQRVQDQIDSETRVPQPDSLRIGQLKRLKLSIKDRMRSILEDDPEKPSSTPAVRSIRREGGAAALGRDA